MAGRGRVWSRGVRRAGGEIDRLPRHAAGRKVHELHQRASDGACVEPGSDRVRGSGVLRPPGAGAGAGAGPSVHDPGDRTADSTGDHDDHAVGDHHAVLPVAPPVADCGSDPGVCGRNAFRVSGIREEFPADTGSATTRLSATAWRQQGRREGIEAFRAAGISDGKVQDALRPGL